MKIRLREVSEKVIFFYSGSQTVFSIRVTDVVKYRSIPVDVIAPQYYYPPTIYYALPSTGHPLGGNIITLWGDHFTDVISVKIGGVSAVYTTYHLGNKLSVTTPPYSDPNASAAGVTIAIETLGGNFTLYNGFTYTNIVVPTISAISPTRSIIIGGAGITLTGTILSNALSVKVNGVTGTIVNNTATSIYFLSPASPVGMTTANILVTTSGGQVSTTGKPFTYFGDSLPDSYYRAMKQNARELIDELYLLSGPAKLTTGTTFTNIGRYQDLDDQNYGFFKAKPGGRFGLTGWTGPLLYKGIDVSDIFAGITAPTGVCGNLTYNLFGSLSRIHYIYGVFASDNVPNSRLTALNANPLLIKRPYSFNDITTFGLINGKPLNGSNPMSGDFNTNHWTLDKNKLTQVLCQIDENQSYSFPNYLSYIAPAIRFQNLIKNNSVNAVSSPAFKNYSMASDSVISGYNDSLLAGTKLLLSEYRTHYPIARPGNGVYSDMSTLGDLSYGYYLGGIRWSGVPAGNTNDIISSTSFNTWTPEPPVSDQGMYLFDGWGVKYLLDMMVNLTGNTLPVNQNASANFLLTDESSEWATIMNDMRNLFVKEIYDYVFHSKEGRPWYQTRNYTSLGLRRDGNQSAGGGRDWQNSNKRSTGYWATEPDNRGYIGSNQHVTPMAARMKAAMYLYKYAINDDQRAGLLAAYNMCVEYIAAIIERLLVGADSDAKVGSWSEGWGYASQSMPDLLEAINAARSIGDKRVDDTVTIKDYTDPAHPAGISYSCWIDNSWKWIVSRILPNNLITNSGSCNSPSWETLGNVYQFVPYGLFTESIIFSQYPAPGTTGSALSEVYDWFIHDDGGSEYDIKYFSEVKKYINSGKIVDKILPKGQHFTTDQTFVWKSETVIPRFQSDWLYGSNVLNSAGTGYVVSNFNKPLIFAIFGKGVGVLDEKCNQDGGHLGVYLGDAVILMEAGEPRNFINGDIAHVDLNKDLDFYRRYTYRAAGHNKMQLGEMIDPDFPEEVKWSGVTFNATGGFAFIDYTNTYNREGLTGIGFGSRYGWAQGAVQSSDGNWTGWKNVNRHAYVFGDTFGNDPTNYLAYPYSKLTDVVGVVPNGKYRGEPYQYQIAKCTRGITWTYSNGTAKVEIQDIVGISAYNPLFAGAQWTATGPYATADVNRVYYRFHTGYTGALNLNIGNPSVENWPFFSTTDTGLTFFAVSADNKTWQAAWTQPIPYNTMAYDGVASRLNSVGVTMTFVGSQPIKLTKELTVNNSFKYPSVTVPGVGITAPSRHYAINVMLGLSGGSVYDEMNLRLNTTIDATVKKRDNFSILFGEDVTVEQENKLNALGAKKYYLTSRGLSAGWNLTKTNIDAAVTYLKGEIFEVGGNVFGRGLTATSKSFIFLDFESSYDPITKTGGPTVDIMLIDGHTGPSTEGQLFGQTSANKYFYEWIEGGTSNSGTTFFGLRHYFPGCSFGNYGPHWWWGSNQWYGKTDAEINAQLDIAANTMVTNCGDALRAFDIFSPSVYSNVNNRKLARWNNAQNVRLYKKINALLGTNKPIMPWVTPMYYHNGTGTPYTTSISPTGYPNFGDQYTPPFTMLLDSDIVYENAEPLIAEGASGVLVWNNPEYRIIQALGRTNCPTCDEYNLIGFEGRTAQAVDGKYQQWPLDKPTTPGASPAGLTLNEWSLFTAVRQAISAHENYIKGRDMGVTGNRWWWQEISGSTVYTPPEWGNLNTNIQWNGSVTTGTTGAEIIRRTYRDTFYNMAKVIKETYLTKDQWISGMTGPLKGLTGNRTVNGVPQ